MRVAIHIVPLLLLFTRLAFAAPPVVLEDARLVPLDGAPEGYFGRSSDIDGDVAVVGATQGAGTPENATPGAAYIFERQADGTWQQAAKLLPLSEVPGGGWGASNFGVTVALDGQTIVVGSRHSGETAVFERSGGVWQRVSTLADTDGYFVDIHSGTIITSHGSGFDLYRRSASGWAKVQRVSNGYHLGDIDDPGAHIAISATTAIHGSDGVDDDYPGAPSGTAYIYPLGPDGTWQAPNVSAVTRPNAGPGQDGFSTRVAISNGTAVICCGDSGGLPDVHIFERDGQGAWNPVQIVPGGGHIAVDGNTALVGAGQGWMHVYRRTSAGEWTHQATLASSTGEPLTRPAIRGNQVIAGPFVFTLPAVIEPAPLLQEDLEDGAANGWTPQGTSAFSVVSAGGTRVYRQSNMTAGASAVYEGVDWGDNPYKPQADVTPRAYATPAGKRWFGLMVRYTDALNYYYVTMRNSNTVELKRMINGSFQTLASAPLPVTLNRTYSLRLEAHGQLLRVFVDGALVLDATDAALGGGRVGIAMFKTQADFDNLIVGSNPRLQLQFEDFNQSYLNFRWENLDPTLQWVKERSATVFKQPTTTGGAHAVTGYIAADQIIQARMRATAVAGADRWFGLIGRFVDATNYYYLTVRSDNTISLRKLTNGGVTILDTASLPFTLNAWRTLRLEIVDNKLRGYVDGRLVVEAVDATPHAAGRYGVGSYKTAAEADDFTVTQP